MDHWLTIIIVLLIVAIVIDGLRRMRRARRDSLKMALRPVSRSDTDTDDGNNNYGSEFPSGGARPSNRKIDPERIQQARNKYDFGKDMSAWKNKVADKIAEHTGMKEETEKLPERERIEPSLDELDPLLDKLPESPLRKRSVEVSTPEPAEDDIESELPINATEETQTAALSSETTQKQEPVQTSLNLDDAVPMLMDSLDDADVLEVEDTRQQVTTKAKEKPEKIVPVAARVKSSEQEHSTHSANKPRYESKYVDHTQKVAAPQEVLVIHVRAPQNEYFYGDDLLELILDSGLRYGAMDIFHHHADEDGEGPILFSMANMVKPGTFDLHNFEELSTVGVSFFLTLPTETGKNMDAFEKMLSTATRIANKLHGELQDENRSILTKQTMEHYRERIRDFSRRQQLEKNKH